MQPISPSAGASATPFQHDNPYLTDAFAPVFQEIRVDHLEVVGELPRDIRGTYYRNGPNPMYPPKGRYHWFDGDGMIHALSLEGGKARYKNAWVRTAGLAHDQAAGQARYSGLIEPDPSNPLGMIKDNANTDLIEHNGELLALFYRCGEPYAVDMETLATLGPRDFEGLTAPVSAHAKRDPRSGHLMVFHYDLKPPFMHYGVISPGGRLQHWTPVPLPGPRLPHDMAITPNYSILMDLPTFLDPEALRHGKQKLDFFPHIPSRFAVIPRFGGLDEIRWFEAEPCYIYHVVNAWEEGQIITMDVCRVSQPVPPRTGPRLSDLDRMKRVLAEALQTAVYYRYQFDLETGQTSEQQLSDQVSEFPVIDQERSGRKNRFSYHVGLPPMDTLRFDALIKHDGQSGRATRLPLGKDTWGSEPAFASRRRDGDEDDGYLLSFVHNEAEARSECWVLDAKNIEHGPMARVLLPQRVPLGFHGTWIPDRVLKPSK